MRVRLVTAIVAAATVLVPTVAHAQEPPPPIEVATEWKEVFSEDGTITRVEVPVQIDPPLRAEDITPSTVSSVSQAADANGSFDVVIVGDGYTANQQDLALQDARDTWNAVAQTAPWNRYRAQTNVWLVEVVSNQSGVDNDPSRGVSRDTAMDMGFWCNNMERLLCVNVNKANAFARQAPVAADAVIAIANSTKYGGAGYPSVSTASGGHPSAPQIVMHELGHSVGGLGDEYWSPGTTHSGGEPREPNVTANPQGTKWASYLGQPTPDGGTIGVYEGGRYVERGIYRPSQDSLMRSLGKPFNSVSLDVMDRAIRARINSPAEAAVEQLSPAG